MPTVDLIILGIRSAMKLGERGRLAYADTLRRRELLMPLANFEPGFFNVNRARNYLRGNPPVGPLSEEEQRIYQAIMDSGLPGGGIPDGPEREAAEQFYNACKLADDIRNGTVTLPGGEQFDQPATLTLLKVAQWSEADDPTMSVVERMAGTVIDIGIDYFQANPGVIDGNTRIGKAFAAVVSGLDTVEYGEVGLSSLPRRMIFAVLESVEGDAAGLVDDPAAQALISSMAGSIGTNVRQRLENIGDLNLNQSQAVEYWGETVLRSVLDSAGRMVATEPGRFLGLKSASGQAMVQKVGTELLDIVLDTEHGAMGDALHKGSLDRLAASALAVVGDHPDMIARGEGLKAVIGGVARDLSGLVAGGQGLDAALVPEAVRLVIAKTGENMDRFWPTDADSGGLDLLKSAAGTVLSELSAPVASGTWSPRFSGDQALQVADTVLGQIADNPGWLVDQANDVDRYVGTAMAKMLEVLRTRADKRLKPETGIAMIKAGMIAAAQRIDLVDRTTNGKPIVAAALDMVLSRAFDPALDTRAKAALLRSEVLLGLHQAALDGLNKAQLTPEALATLEQTLDDLVARLSAGDPLDLEAIRQILADSVQSAGGPGG